MPNKLTWVGLVLGALLASSCGTLPNSITINFQNPTPDFAQVVEATFRAMTAQAHPGQTPTPQPTGLANDTASPATLASAASDGSIAGNLMYPGSQIPALRIVAFGVGGSFYYYVDTVPGQGSYVLQHTPPGVYHVVAYPLPADAVPATLAGGYSKMVPCGLKYGCNDHTLIDVIVVAGSVTSGVDPNDYYADAGSFPANPVP